MIDAGASLLHYRLAEKIAEALPIAKQNEHVSDLESARGLPGSMQCGGWMQ